MFPGSKRTRAVVEGTADLSLDALRDIAAFWEIVGLLVIYATGESPTLPDPKLYDIALRLGLERFGYVGEYRTSMAGFILQCLSRVQVEVFTPDMIGELSRRFTDRVDGRSDLESFARNLVSLSRAHQGDFINSRSQQPRCPLVFVEMLQRFIIGSGEDQFCRLKSAKKLSHLVLGVGVFLSMQLLHLRRITVQEYVVAIEQLMADLVVSKRQECWIAQLRQGMGSFVKVFSSMLCCILPNVAQMPQEYVERRIYASWFQTQNIARHHLSGIVKGKHFASDVRAYVEKVARQVDRLPLRLGPMSAADLVIDVRQGGVIRKYTPVDCGAGGDCLFRAIAAQMNNGRSAAWVRQLVASYYATEAGAEFLRTRVHLGVAGSDVRLHYPGCINKVEGDIIPDVDTYRRLMAQQGTWGGGVEIEALSRLLDCSVRLISFNQECGRYYAVSSNPRGRYPTISIYFDSEAGHYMALRPVASPPSHPETTLYVPVSISLPYGRVRLPSHAILPYAIPPRPLPPPSISPDAVASVLCSLGAPRKKRAKKTGPAPGE